MLLMSCSSNANL